MSDCYTLRLLRWKAELFQRTGSKASTPISVTEREVGEPLADVYTSNKHKWPSAKLLGPQGWSDTILTVNLHDILSQPPEQQSLF